MILKRLFDIIAALAGLAVFAIPMIIVAILVRTRLGTPVLFRQVRPGLNAEPFTIFKFRTMTDETDENGDPLPDEKRLPPFGIWLRRLSLDELPQLFNVLRGDMSVVGPRPLLTEYLEFYTPEQARRHEARPGVTGWAQVNGRNALSWPEKFALDVWYVDNQSFLLDLKIILKTIKLVLSGEGVSMPGHVTFRRFDEIMREKQAGKSQTS